MKIAGIAITYNDGYKLREWRQWYEEYKDELYLYIIVDNGSEQQYLRQLESSFPDAILIKRTTNGGCTSAYNDGIKRALEDSNVTHIALIGNDIRLEPCALTKCASYLDKDDELGMIAPVLLNADSNIVADYGCNISSDLLMVPYGLGVEYDKLTPEFRYCDSVTGGMNISKRIFYEAVGLQDEKMFMYSDEVEMGIRANKKGFKMGVLKSAKSWHQHINPIGMTRRKPYSSYLIARNKIYVAKKHFGLYKAFYVFCQFVKKSIKGFTRGVLSRKYNSLIDYRWMLLGAINGLLGNMKPNKYSHL